MTLTTAWWLEAPDRLTARVKLFFGSSCCLIECMVDSGEIVDMSTHEFPLRGDRGALKVRCALRILRAAPPADRKLHALLRRDRFRLPERTDPAGHRRYRDPDILRLYRVLSLSRLGLALEEVATALKRSSDDLDACASCSPPSSTSWMD